MEIRDITVRPLVPTDREAWGVLWRGYLDYYETELPAEMYDLAFERLLSDDPFEYDGIVADSGGRLVGLAHYLFHRHGWRREEICYLQDLFVAPDARGSGAGRALIEGVYAAADAAGSPRVYWLTQEFNVHGRRLYDRVAALTPFIKYERPA